MIRKPDLADRSACLLFAQPVIDTHFDKALPGLVVCKHVHQVIVHMICAKAAELLLKTLLSSIKTLHQVVRQLCGNIKPVPDACALEDLADRSLRSWINICCIVIVDACFKRSQYLGLGLVQVYAASLLSKTHAAEAQYRNIVSVFVLAVIHYLFCVLCVLMHLVYCFSNDSSTQRSSLPIAFPMIPIRSAVL